MMKMELISRIFLGVLIYFTSQAMNGIKAKESVPEKIKVISVRMNAFPVDFIARNGPLSYCRIGDRVPKICYRNELTKTDFRAFYGFCLFSLQMDGADIDECVSHLKDATPKERALLLSAIYIAAFPWSEERFVSLRQTEGKKPYWSWLALNYISIIRVTQKREAISDRSKIKKMIERFQDDQDIAFPSINVSPAMLKEQRSDFESLVTKKNDRELFSIGFEIHHRREAFMKIRKEYPSNCEDMISDLLWFYHQRDHFPVGEGILPNQGNTSVEPKTVGQIARQLLASWDAPPAVSIEEWKKRQNQKNNTAKK